MTGSTGPVRRRCEARRPQRSGEAPGLFKQEDRDGLGGRVNKHGAERKKSAIAGMKSKYYNGILKRL